MTSDEQVVKEEIKQQQSKDAALKQELFACMASSRPIAEWMFYDAFYDCDNLAATRVDDRLRRLSAEHGQNAMFGIAGWWAMRSYWKLQEVWAKRDIPGRPDLVPTDVDKILASSDAEQKRPFVSAQQFISTLTHDNPLMANAILDVVYNQADLDEFIMFMQHILIVALRCEHTLVKVS